MIIDICLDIQVFIPPEIWCSRYGLGSSHAFSGGVDWKVGRP